MVPAYLATRAAEHAAREPAAAAVRAGDPDHGGDRAASREVRRSRSTRGWSAGVPTATRSRQLLEGEHFDRIIAPGAGRGSDGFSPEDVAWLLDNAEGEIVIFRSGDLAEAAA